MRFLLSVAFIIANVAILFLGVYYWIADSQYRIMILYSIFAMIIFWLTSSHKQEISRSGRIAFGSVVRWFGISAVVLSAFLILATSESLYIRPAETSVVMVAVLVSLMVVFVVDAKVNDARFTRQPAFLLAMLTFVILYAKFSIYLVQPNLMGGPAYASVDAYRDYANAVRILASSGFRPNMMILERYYQAFPVVPLQIAITGLVTGLPCNIAHLIMGLAFELLSVSCSVLLVWAVIGKHRHVPLPVVTLLPVLIVLLQPILIDPITVLTPLSLSVPFISLALYLCLSATNRDPGWNRSSYLSILVVMFIMVPMHAASPVMMIILFSAIALFSMRTGSTKSISVGVAALTLLCLGLYLISLAGAPMVRLLDNARLVYLAIKEILSAGPSFLMEIGARGTVGAVEWNEVSSFLMSVPPALVLAIASVMIVRLLEQRNGAVEWDSTKRRGEMRLVRLNLRSLYLCFGVLFVLGFGSSYALHYSGWGATRYLVFPLAPLALLATTVILIWTLRNMNTRRGLVLIGLLTIYAISVVTSPVFLHESSPLAARLTPVQSERAAASFLSAKFEVDSTGVTQIVTDWPFFAHVGAVFYSEHVSGPYLRIPILMPSGFSPMVTGQRTIMLSREYFIQNAYLKGLSPYETPLTDLEKWRSFNRIFDDSSTSIYWGTL